MPFSVTGMNARYFDAHCHIQFEQYDADQAEIIERMRERGIAGVVVGVDRKSSEQAIALAEKHEHLFASVGLHPNRVTEEWFEAKACTALAKHPKVIAIGECGLDYFRPAELTEEMKEKQKRVLGDHIELAGTLDKPLIIHSRPSKGTQDAYHDLIQILKMAKLEYPALRGDIHFFVGGVTEMQELAALGFTVSFTAVITFTHDYDEVIRATPLTSILSETDSPYVAPASRRGSRNDPLAVEDVAAKIALIRGEDQEMVRKMLVQNALNLFKPPHTEAV